jgi:hypothetical protein
MKITLLLCLAVALAACQGCSKPFRSTVGPAGGTDSPIIVSDGSPELHLKHKGVTNADFQIVFNGTAKVDQIVVNDVDASGTPFTSMTVDLCPAGKGSCSNVKLTAPWSLDIIGINTSTTVSATVMTIASTSGSSITTDFHGKCVVLGQDTTDTQGTDLNAIGFKLSSFANFTNNGSAVPSVSCVDGQRCKLCIHFETPGTTNHQSCFK